MLTLLNQADLLRLAVYIHPFKDSCVAVSSHKDITGERPTLKIYFVCLGSNEFEQLCY